MNEYIIPKDEASNTGNLPKSGYIFSAHHYWLVVSKIFYFHPYLRKIPFLTNIFQMGWNHQLDWHCFLPWLFKTRNFLLAWSLPLPQKNHKTLSCCWWFRKPTKPQWGWSLAVYPIGFPGVLCITAFRYFGSVLAAEAAEAVLLVAAGLPVFWGALRRGCAQGRWGPGRDWKEERWDQSIHNWIFQVCKISCLFTQTKLYQMADTLGTCKIQVYCWSLIRLLSPWVIRDF